MIKIAPAVANAMRSVTAESQQTLFALPKKADAGIVPVPFNTSVVWVNSWVKMVLRAYHFIPNCKSVDGYNAALPLFAWSQFTPAQDAAMRQAVKEYLGL